MIKIITISFSGKLLYNSIFWSSCILKLLMSMDSCQTQIYIPIDSSSINDNSNEELEILSNLHIALAKNFLSYLEMRIYRMSFPLTQSDRFLIDLHTTCIYNPPYPKHSIHDLVIVKYKPKYGFIYIRFHDDIRSKDHLHNSHLKNYLLICK